MSRGPGLQLGGGACLAAGVGLQLAMVIGLLPPSLTLALLGYAALLGGAALFTGGLLRGR